MGCLRELNGHFFSRSQSVWKYFFSEKAYSKTVKENPQVDWKRLSNFGEVQKVRFLSIFSKARKKPIFFRMFIKTQRKVLITLNSLYWWLFLNALQENTNFYTSFKCFHIILDLSMWLWGRKKTSKMSHVWDRFKKEATRTR